MKKLSFIALFFCSSVFGQTLTDIASAQNINVLQSTSDHFGNGMSFYDFDEDGWDDLTFAIRQDSVAFFKNNNGTFTQIGSMLYSIGNMREILWVDYDNDNVLDLCASYSDFGVRLYKNDGAFNFTDVTSAIGISTTPSAAYGFSFADPDSDGDLDLYVCNYEAAGFPAGAISNQFYENTGGGMFNEIGSASGIDNGLQVSFMGVWFDYDNDDLIDLHVINDRQPFKDALYKNNGNNLFTDVAVAEGIANNGHNPMTSSVSDFNNDGFQDVFVTDIANGWTVNGVTVAHKLFKNQNGGNFINVAQAMGLDTLLYAWGAVWVDYNNDGFEDLYVATSYIDTVFNPNRSSLMFRNNGGLSFTLINDSIFGDIVNSSYCPVKGDIDNDGFYDIVVQNDGAYPNVLSNNADINNNYVKITPIGTVSNSRAIGSKIKVYAGGISQYQTVFCGSGFCAQNSQHMIFGIGGSTVVDSVIVTFPSGIIAKRYNLAINQAYEIPEQLIVSVDIIPSVDTLTLCYGDSIAIGTSGYTDYIWNTGSTDSIIVVSATGNYEYEAISSNGDSVIQSNVLHVIIESTPLYLELITDPICGEGNFGEVEILFIIPADTTYTVTWQNGSQGQILDSILPGNYTYTLTSQNNCDYTYAFTIAEVLPFDVIFMTTPTTDSTGGTVQFNIFGGVGPFTYTLDTTIVGSYIDSLDAGTYSIEIVDANNCVVITEFTIMDGSTSAISTNAFTGNNVYYSNKHLWICSELIEDILKIELVDISGRSIELDEWGKVNDRCIKTPVELPQGIYSVHVKTTASENTQIVFVR